MTAPNWTILRRALVPASPVQGYWTLIEQYVEGPVRLKFEVLDVVAQNGVDRPNRWSYANASCTADGEPKAINGSLHCHSADAAPGALIGKIGGSPCIAKADAQLFFGVGSFCVIALDDKTKGALYLAMNLDPLVPQGGGQLSVQIWYSP